MLYGLVVLFFALGDLVEIIPALVWITQYDWFHYLHEIHDIVALIFMVAVAHHINARLGGALVIWFLLLHIPYFSINFTSKAAENLRLVLMLSASLFTIYIINSRQRLERQLLEQAQLDSLTGLLNHRAFHQELERQLALARRYQENVAVLFIDLDRFKLVNDTFGHQAGDAYLRQIGDIMRQHFRTTDILARIGGDEFAALFPHTNSSQAQVVIERFSHALANIKINGELQASASLGLVIYPQDGENAERLMAAADQAMYTAKAEARQRITHAAQGP